MSIAPGRKAAALASEMPRQSAEVSSAARARVQALVDLVGAHVPEGTDPAQAQAIAATMVRTLQLARTLGGKAGRA